MIKDDLQNLQDAAMYQGEALRLFLEIEDDTIDCTIADPPYSSGGAFRSDRVLDPNEKYVQGGTIIDRMSFTGDNRDSRSWGYWMTLWLGQALRTSKVGGYCLIFTDWRQLPMATDVFQAGGWVWRGIIVWDKTGAARAPHTGYFRHQCEYIVWGTKGPCNTRDGEGPWPGVFRHPIRQSDKHHMTGKPTPLMVDLVKCVPVGGIVLDPFAGSGTTGVAALQTGRRFVGFEYVEEYTRLCVSRLSAARDNVALVQKTYGTDPRFLEGLPMFQLNDETLERRLV